MDNSKTDTTKWNDNKPASKAVEQTLTNPQATHTFSKPDVVDGCEGLDHSQLKEDRSKCKDDKPKCEDHRSKCEDDRSKCNNDRSKCKDDKSKSKDDRPKRKDESSDCEDDRSNCEEDSSDCEDDKSKGKDDKAKGKDDKSKGKDDKSKGKDDKSKGKDDNSKGKDDNSKGKDDKSKGKDDKSKSKEDKSKGKDDVFSGKRPVEKIIVYGPGGEERVVQDSDIDRLLSRIPLRDRAVLYSHPEEVCRWLKSRECNVPPNVVISDQREGENLLRRRAGQENSIAVVMAHPSRQDSEVPRKSSIGRKALRALRDFMSSLAYVTLTGLTQCIMASIEEDDFLPIRDRRLPAPKKS